MPYDATNRTVMAWRRENGRDHEDTDNGVAPLGGETGRGDDAGTRQQHQEDRQLEADTEGEYQAHDERKILIDFRFDLDREAEDVVASRMGKQRERATLMLPELRFGLERGERLQELIRSLLVETTGAHQVRRLAK